MSFLNIDVGYLTFMTESHHQAMSLASYLQNHGIDAGVDGSCEVTCGIDANTDVDEIWSLRRQWPKFWENCDSQLYQIPTCTSDVG